jgi:hypothetical protein
MNIFKVLLLLVLMLLAPLARADTTWVASGNVSGVWGSAGSPYVVSTGDITVAANDTLLIQPGVRVYFAGGYKFVINGLLQAVGTETDSIWFTGDPTGFPADLQTRFRGIRFVDAHEECRLSYCSISYGGAYGNGAESFGGGVYCYNTDLYVDHSLIDHCHCGKQTVVGRGCGMYIEESSVVLEYSNFNNNYPSSSQFNDYYNSGLGAGMSIKNSDLTMRHCRVYRNVTSTNASAIHFQTGCAALLDSCLIDSNSYYEGLTAMIADTTSDVTFRGTTISHNNRYGYGSNAGLVCNGARSVMDACTLSNNLAGWVGPGPNSGGCALKIRNPVSATITNSVFRENRGDYGGAILCKNTTISNCDFISNISTNGSIFSNGGNRISDCRFINNEATIDISRHAYYGDGWGGAIEFGFGIDTVENCRFEGNFATLYEQETTLKGSNIGGALYCDSTASPYIVNCVFVDNDMNQFECFGSGSVLYNNAGHPTLEYCTIDNNPASGCECVSPYGTYDSPGGVIYSWRGVVTLRNCIVSNTAASCAVYFSSTAGADISFCDFYGISDGLFGGNVPAGLGTIVTANANGDPSDEFYNIYLDPNYVDAVNGDLHLADVSACIGGADPASIVAEDFEHSTRPQGAGSIADIGAFESAISGVLASVRGVTISSDEDLNDIVLRWSANPGAGSYDIYAGDAPEFDPENFVLIGSTALTTYTDEDVLLSSERRTYFVVAVP